MNPRVTITAVFDCSLERAFKSPMLCDVAKVHTGFAGVMPKVTHCRDDARWGQPGGSKQIFVERSLTQKGGWAFVDRVIERRENQYWKIELSEFQFPMFGLSRFTGEWSTEEIASNKILITYTYTLHSDIGLLYLMHWLFAQTMWRVYMRRVLENVRQLAMSAEPYLYA